VTTELEWSAPDNRHWWDDVPIEGMGKVTVTTCRPWRYWDDPQPHEQADFYETMMFWGPEVAGRQQIVVDHYASERTALSGHRYWELPEVIAQTLVELRNGTFQESNPPKHKPATRRNWGGR
jgi:hypothetical protein